MSNSGAGWGTRTTIVVLLSVIASLITIFVFLSGKESIHEAIGPPEATTTHGSGADPTRSISRSPEEIAQTGMVSPPRPSISGDLTDGKVLQLLYGNYDALKGRAIWQATEGDLQRYELDSGFGQTVHTEVILNEQIYQDGEIRRIVLTSTNLESGNGCHACSPVIGGALFTQTQGGWMLDFEQRIIGHMGSWGTPPPVELVRIGPDRYGAVFLHEYQSQGLISRTAFFIAPIATSFVKILTLDVGRDDRGFYVDGSGVAYSSTYRLVPGDNGDYYELVVRTSGTRQDSNGTVVPINDTTTYVFSGMRYEPKL